MVMIINQNTKAINDRDQAAFIKSFATSATADLTQVMGIYDYMVNHENEVLIKLEKPLFQALSYSDQYSVTISRTLYMKDSNETKIEPSSTYYFKKIDNEWQLMAID
jgi:hypothetical protein